MLLRSIIFSFLVLLATLPTRESFAQWGGQGSGIPGMQGMRRGAGRNANNPDSPSNSPQPTRASQLSPGSHLLTYEQMETRLSELEQSLKLSNDQMKAWNTFAIKVRLYASDVAKERAKLNADNPTTSDGLKYLNQASEDSKNRYTALKEVEESAKPLYKMLNTEQKSIFDNKVPTFIATTPKRLGASQPNYNLPDLGSSSTQSNTQSTGSNSLPGYIHQ